MENFDEYIHEQFIKTSQKVDRLVYSNHDELDFLFHYTELNGFLGIFTTKSLWASNAFFLNDFSEIEYGLKISHNFFEIFYSSIKSEKIKEIMKGFYDNYSEVVLDSNLFLVSFCENGDLLSQWRGYAQNTEGVSLRFNSRVIRTLPYVNLHKVIYEEEIQSKIIICLFELLRVIMDYAERNGKSFLFYFNLWVTKFVAILLTFKDISFSEEKEWRLIYNHDVKGNNKIIEYRAKNNYILPYVKIENLSLINLISQIIIGPSTNNKVFGKSISYFLKMHNYDINVEYSKIPFRK
jgi:hypothetical protein